MKYIRQFNRQQTQKSNKVMLKEREGALAPQILASLAAMCCVFTPLTASATDLTRTDGGVTKTSTSGTAITADVYAGRLMASNKNVAVNKFAKFDVSKGDTVNLHYGLDNNSNTVTSLVNFVNDRININGAVKTVQHMDKEYDGYGTLYFLSKDGMTVGKDGIINAGILIAATPSDSNWNNLINNDDALKNMMDNYVSLTQDVDNKIFPLNKSGSIVVENDDSLHTILDFEFAPTVDIQGNNNIVRTDGGLQLRLKFGGQKYTEIFAGKIYKNAATAVNTFSKFKVNPNDVVDMYLRTMVDGDDGIYNLVNLVDDKIDINGVVNLVKDNANLFFLSSNGLVVGADGVINAGAFYGLIPTKSAYDSLKSGGERELKELTLRPEKVEINPTGDITVNGEINTTAGVMLRAGHNITLGSDQGENKGAYSPSLKSTGAFEKIVKLSDDQKKYVEDKEKEALRKNLNGDIVLEAATSNHNNRTDGESGEEASIVQHGTIEAGGNVNLQAKAIGDKLSFVPYYHKESTTANIDIYGKITGQTITGNAEAKNDNAGGAWTSTAKAAEKMALNALLSSGTAGISQLAGHKIIPVEADAMVAIEKSSASVAVHKDADLNATGGVKSLEVVKVIDNGSLGGKITPTGEFQDIRQNSLNLTATSTLKYSGSAKPYESLGSKDSSKVASIGVNYLKSENSSAVTVDGKLSTVGDTNLKAVADSNINASTSISSNPVAIKAGTGQSAALSVTWVDASNRARTSIGANADLKNLTGSVTAAAKAVNSIKTSASASSNKEGSLALAVNRTVYNSSSNVDVAAGIDNTGSKSYGAAGILLKSENITSKNSFETSSKAGQMNPKVKSELDELIVGKKGSGSILEWFSGTTVGKWLGGSKLLEAVNPSNFNLMDSFNGALSVGLLTEKNTSGIHVGDVGLKTGGDLTMLSNTKMENIGVHVDSAALNKQTLSSIEKIKKEQGIDIPESKVKFAGSLSILLADVTNDSKTVIDSSDSGKPDDNKAIKGDNVEIKAVTELPDSLWSAAKEYWGKYLKEPSASGFIPYVNTSDFYKYAGLLEGKFLSQTNFANFTVRALTDQGAGGKAINSSTGASGMINVNTVNSNSNVLIGSGRIINAQNLLKTEAKNTGTLTSINGNLDDKLGVGISQGSLMGGSYNQQTINGNSTTLVGQDSKLNGQNVDVLANNKLAGVGLALGAGLGSGKLNLTGMVSNMRGTQTAIAAVDKSVLINQEDTGDAAKNKEVNIKAENSQEIINVAGTASVSSSGNSGANIGAGVAINEFNINTVSGVMDLSSHGAEQEKDEAHVTLDTDAYNKASDFEKSAMDFVVKIKNQEIDARNKKLAAQRKVAKATKELIKETIKQTGENQDKLFGSTTSTNSGKITGGVININGVNTGTILGIGAAGAASDSGGANEAYTKYDGVKGSLIGLFDGKILNNMDKYGAKTIKYGAKAIKNLFHKKNAQEIAAEKAEEAKKADEEAKKAAEEAKKKDEDAKKAAGEANKEAKEQSGSGWNFTLAGSGVYNGLEENTVTLVDDTTIDAKDGKLAVGAKEDTVNRAIAGAASLSMFGSTHNSSETDVGIAGAAAVNNNDHQVVSYLRNTNISNAQEVKQTAENKGEDLALALGAGIANNGSKEGSTFELTGSVALNMGSRNTSAVISGTRTLFDSSEISNVKDLKVNATDDSMALAAAAGFSYSNGYSFDGMVAYNDYGGNSDKPHQVEALVQGMDIAADNLSVKAKDNARVYTLAAGASMSTGSLAASGSAGAALIDKKVYGGLEETNVYDHAGKFKDYYYGKVKDGTGSKLDVGAVNNASVLTLAGEAAFTWSSSGNQAAGVNANAGGGNAQDQQKDNDDNAKDQQKDNAGNAQGQQNVDQGKANEKSGLSSKTLVTGPYDLFNSIIKWSKQKHEKKVEEQKKAAKADESKTSGIGVGLGVSFNSIAEDTTASVTGGNQNVTDALVKAQANPDIVGVGVGIAAAGGGSGVGSLNYNKVANNVNANITDARLTAQGSVGVVAQTDDQLLNVAGVAALSKKGSAGLSIGINRIDGTTAAVVKGSKITAYGKTEDGIAVSEADSNKLIKEVKLNPLHGNSDLKKGRKDRTYTGLVVESTATHDLSSMMATLAAGYKGSGSGTLNINDVRGATTATVEDSRLNKDIDLNQQENKNANVAVRSEDYTNNKGITGGASGGGSAAIGLTGEWSTVSRTVGAEVKGESSGIDKDHPGQKAEDDVRAQDFKVQAVSEQGMSSADVAAAVQASGSGGGAALTGSGIWNKLASSTSAKVDGVQVKYAREADISAKHEGYINTGSVSAAISAGVGGGSVGAGFVYGSNQEQSRTNAEVNNSNITAASKSGSALNVTADSKSELRQNLLAVGVAANFDPYSPGIAISGSMGWNDLQALTSVNVADSTLAADKIDILSRQDSKGISLIGGVAGGSWVGVGASISKTDFTDKVNTNVTGSKITAKDGDLTVDAQSLHNTDQHVGNAGIGGIAGLSVNWIEVGVNNEASRLSSKDQLGTERGKIVEQEDHINQLFAQQLGGLDTGVKSGTNEANKELLGVHVNIMDSQLESTKGKLEVKAEEDNKYDVTGGALSVGLAGSASGSVAKVKENHQIGVTLSNSELKGQDVAVNAKRGNIDADGSMIHTVQGGGSLIGTAGLSYAYASSEGMTGIYIIDTGIKADNKAQIGAKDEAKIKTSATGGNVALSAAVGYVQAYVENGRNDVKVKIASSAGEHEISGNTALDISAAKATQNEAKASGVSLSSFSGSGTLANVRDSGDAVVQVERFVPVVYGKTDDATAKAAAANSRYTFSGKEVNVSAVNDSRLKTVSDGVGGGLWASAGVTRGDIDYTGKAKVLIEAGNTFKTNNLTVESRMGDKDHYTAESKVTSGSYGAGATLGMNRSTVKTDTESVVDVGEEVYLGRDESENKLNSKNRKKAGDTEQKTVVTLRGQNFTSRKADIAGKSISALAVGRNDAVTEGADRVLVSAGGGSVKDLNVEAAGETKAYAKTEGSGGGLLVNGTKSAHAENKLATSSVAIVSGTWKVKDQVKAHAKQNDTSLIHAGAHQYGAVVIGGADARTEIKDYADAQNPSAPQGTQVIIAKDADITASKVDARAANVFMVKAADGKATTVNKDYKSKEGRGNDDESIVSVSVGGAGSRAQNTQAVQIVNKTATVTVAADDKNKDLPGAKVAGAQVYEASTTGTIIGTISSDAYGAHGHADTKAINEVTIADKVNVAGRLKGGSNGNTGDITMAAWDDLHLAADATSMVGSAFGGTDVEARNTVKRTSEVNLTGSADDAKSLNLYTGRKADDKAGKDAPQGYLYAYGYNDDHAMGFTNDPMAINEIISLTHINIGEDAYGNVGSPVLVFEPRVFSAKSQIKKNKYSGDTDVSTEGDKNTDEYYVHTKEDNWIRLNNQHIGIKIGQQVLDEEKSSFEERTKKRQEKIKEQAATRMKLPTLRVGIEIKKPADTKIEKPADTEIKLQKPRISIGG